MFACPFWPVFERSAFLAVHARGFRPIDKIRNSLHDLRARKRILTLISSSFHDKINRLSNTFHLIYLNIVLSGKIEWLTGTTYTHDYIFSTSAIMYVQLRYFLKWKSFPPLHTLNFLIIVSKKLTCSKIDKFKRYSSLNFVEKTFMKKKKNALHLSLSFTQ
mgnify:CR=1 FL=1